MIQARNAESIDISHTDIGEYFDQPVKHYSSGMFARLSSAIHVNRMFSLLMKH